MDELACRVPVAAFANFHLRTAFGFMDASARARRSTSHISRARSETSRLHHANELYPGGTAADHRAPVLCLVGIPDYGAFCSNLTLRRPRGRHGLRGLPSLAR